MSQTLAVALALAGVSLHAEDYAISSFAGVGSVAGGADGTPGTFNNPVGVAIDSAKNVYVADTTNNTVRKITPGGVVSTLAGMAGASGATDATGSAARFNFPVGVTVDSGGNVYVSDGKNMTIRRITPAGAVSTFAGTAFQIGSVDGTGNAARFFLPYGLAIDSGGNVYVADGGNHTIRKISPGGVVTTLAGAALQSGFANGSGNSARFNSPWAVAVDGGGNVYVADSDNHVIRRITAAGVVTTVAGSPGVLGSTDGPAASARFNQPRGIAVDAGGNLYVTDSGNGTIRQITAGGMVTTIAGTPGIVGSTDSVGPAARFFDPAGIIVDGSTIYVADTTNNLIRRGVPASQAALPNITVQPIEQEVAVGQSVTLRVVAEGSSLSYQWLRNGEIIQNATSSSYTLSSPQVGDSAAYSVRVRSSGGSRDSQVANVSVVPPGTGAVVITARPLNQQVNPGQSVTFSVTATGSGLTYQWLKNGSVINGATSASYTIASPQAGDAGTYTVRITSGATTETAQGKLIVGSNSGPGFTITTQPASQRVPPGQPATFFVAISGTSSVTYQWFKNDNTIGGANGSTYTIAAVQESDAGRYRVRITSTTGNMDSDVATLTVGNNDPDPGPGPTTFSRLSNLSVLTNIASAGDSFQLGYVVGGAGTTGSKPLLIRAAGPSLGAPPINYPGTVGDPKMDLFVAGARTGGNDNWGGTSALSTAFTSVGAFAYTSPTSLDAAFSGNIAAGANSVVVSANGTGTGAVLAEFYDATPIGNMTATTPRLVNVSVLKHIGDALTAGFVIDGNAKKTVLIRGVGPTIGTAPFNVPGAVADPQLTLYSGQTVLATNDNWGGTAELKETFTAVGAFALPDTSRDAALRISLDPGAYTVRITGVNNTTGQAIVEVYEVP